MNEKLEILQTIIDGRAFASSSSALAKELGYKGKMGIYRIVSGEAGGTSVDEVWDRIKNLYKLTDKELYSLARAFYGRKYFYDLLVGEMNTSHPEWVENMISGMIGDTYDYCSPAFQQDVAPILSDLKKEEPDVFWGIAVLVYIRAKGIVLYGRNSESVFSDIYDSLASLLSSVFPEKHDAALSARNIKKAGSMTCLWNLIYCSVLMFRYYTEYDFSYTVSKSLRLLDLGKRSYWVVPGTEYKPGVELWMMIEQCMRTSSNGYYIAIKLQTGKNTEEFFLKGNYIFQFWTVEKEDDLPILQICNRADGEKEISYCIYQYDGSVLSLYFDNDEDNKFGIPLELEKLDLESPEGKSGKVWARVAGKLDGNAGKRFFEAAKERLTGIVILENDYRITDVIISRSGLKLVVESADGVSEYRLSSDGYDFLSKISPTDNVFISQHLSDGNIYVDWPEYGCSVALSEFERID